MWLRGHSGRGNYMLLCGWNSIMGVKPGVEGCFVNRPSLPVSWYCRTILGVVVRRTWKNTAIKCILNGVFL